MGTLTVSGTPDKDWANSTAPLLIQGSGVQGYIAAVKALTENQLSWWQDLAPGVTAPPALVGADNPKYLSPLNVTLTAAGSTVTAISLSNTVAVSGGKPRATMRSRCPRRSGGAPRDHRLDHDPHGLNRPSEAPRTALCASQPQSRDP